MGTTKTLQQKKKMATSAAAKKLLRIEIVSDLV